MASKLQWSNLDMDSAPKPVKTAYQAVKDAEEKLRLEVQKVKGKGLKDGQRVIVTHRRGLAYAIADASTERRTEEW